MVQSSEYPDLTWVTPESWTNANRTAVQLVIIHTTEGSSHEGSAEDGAAYDAHREDGTSTHYFHDSNTTVQCVRTEDQAHAARAQGNRRGIQHELCARAAWSAGQWASVYAQRMLQLAAKQAARDCRKWNIPVRKLTAAEVAQGTRGLCGHVDITRAFPADGGTHTDPGGSFPWTGFIGMVRLELAALITEEEEKSMPSASEIASAVWNADVIPNPWATPTNPYVTAANGVFNAAAARKDLGALATEVGELREELAAVNTQLSEVLRLLTQ